MAFPLVGLGPWQWTIGVGVYDRPNGHFYQRHSLPKKLSAVETLIGETVGKWSANSGIGNESDLVLVPYFAKKILSLPQSTARHRWWARSLGVTTDFLPAERDRRTLPFSISTLRFTTFIAFCWLRKVMIIPGLRNIWGVSRRLPCASEDA
jgi:hypothetical protein